jgi:antirestriction protein ArdC
LSPFRARLSWLKVQQNEVRFIFTAASHAQRAADYLHGLRGASSDTVIDSKRRPFRPPFLRRCRIMAIC